MVRMPEDIALHLGKIDGKHVYYSGWKYEIITFNKDRKEYVLKLIGKVKASAWE